MSVSGRGWMVAPGRRHTIHHHPTGSVTVKMKVVYDDGSEVEAVIGPRAQVETERKYDCLFTDIYDQSAGHARVEKFYFSAWAALHFADQGSAADDFNEWLNRVVDVVPVGEGAAVPTRKGRRRAASSALAS